LRVSILGFAKSAVGVVRLRAIGVNGAETTAPLVTRPFWSDLTQHDASSHPAGRYRALSDVIGRPEKNLWIPPDHGRTHTEAPMVATVAMR
jgi:hypothetical protein